PIFDGKFEFVGMHQEGGRNSDQKSFNSGLATQSLFGVSDEIATAFANAAGAGGGGGGNVVPTVEYRISPTNSSIVKRGGQWIYIVDSDQESVLVEQLNNAGSITLWNPVRDFFFQFPELGGVVKGKFPATTGWVNIGIATRVR